MHACGEAGAVITNDGISCRKTYRRKGEWVEDDIRLKRESKIAKKEWALLGADASVLDNWPLPGCWAW